MICKLLGRLQPVQGPRCISCTPFAPYADSPFRPSPTHQKQFGVCDRDKHRKLASSWSLQIRHAAEVWSNRTGHVSKTFHVGNGLVLQAYLLLGRRVVEDEDKVWICKMHRPITPKGNSEDDARSGPRTVRLQPLHSRLELSATSTTWPAVAVNREFRTP